MKYPNRIELVLTYKHDPEDEEIFTERVDAIKVGDYYKLVNVPAFAPNIAYGDIVKVEYDEGEFHFDALVEESGYSVAHIVVWKPDSKDRVISSLGGLGCEVNGHVAENYVVVSIPPEVDYGQVRTLLGNEKAVENIDFRDCVSKMHGAMI